MRHANVWDRANGPSVRRQVLVDTLPVTVQPGTYKVSCKGCKHKTVMTIRSDGGDTPIVRLAMAGKCTICGEDASYRVPPPCPESDVSKRARRVAYEAVKLMFESEGRSGTLDSFDWIIRHHKGCHIVSFIPEALAPTFYASFEKAVRAEIDRVLDMPTKRFPGRPAKS